MGMRMQTGEYARPWSPLGLWLTWTVVTTAAGIAVDMILLPWYRANMFQTFFMMLLLPIVTICIAQLLTLHRLFHSIYHGILPVTTTVGLIGMCIFAPWITVYVGLFDLSSFVREDAWFMLPLVMLGAALIGMLVALIQFPFVISGRALWWFGVQALAWGISWPVGLLGTFRLSRPDMPTSPWILVTWLSIWALMGAISGAGLLLVRRMEDGDIRG